MRFCLAPPVGGGEKLCLAEPLPTLGEGFRAHHCERQGMGPLGRHPGSGATPRTAGKYLCNNRLKVLVKVLIQTLKSASGESAIADRVIILAADPSCAMVIKGQIHTGTLLRALLDRRAGVRMSGPLAHVYFLTHPESSRGIAIHPPAGANLGLRSEHRAGYSYAKGDRSNSRRALPPVFWVLGVDRPPIADVVFHFISARCPPFPKIYRTRFSQCSVTAGWCCHALGAA